MRQNAVLCGNGVNERVTQKHPRPFKNEPESPVRTMLKIHCQLSYELILILNSWLVVFWFNATLKVALQILGRIFYKNTKKKTSLYSKSFLIFIKGTLVVERHPITTEIRYLLWPISTPTGNTVYFYTEQLVRLHTDNTQRKLQT